MNVSVCVATICLSLRWARVTSLPCVRSVLMLAGMSQPKACERPSSYINAKVSSLVSYSIHSKGAVISLSWTMTISPLFVVNIPQRISALRSFNNDRCVSMSSTCLAWFCVVFLFDCAAIVVRIQGLIWTGWRYGGGGVLLIILLDVWRDERSWDCDASRGHFGR